MHRLVRPNVFEPPGTGILDATVMWTRQAGFAEVLEYTEELPGTFVRCLLRLGDGLRQLADAYQTIGHERGVTLCQRTYKLVVRDIVTCPSLYLK